MTAAAAPLRREVFRFLLVGMAGTAAYLVVYLLLRTAMPAQLTNVTARVAVAVPSTWLTGRYTFGTRVSRPRLYAGALAVLAASTAISAGLLAVEQALVGPTDRLAEIAALAVANAVATAARFVLLRQWLFRRTGLPGDTQTTESPATAAPATKNNERFTTVPAPVTVRATLTL